jgi:hypothetical protein
MVSKAVKSPQLLVTSFILIVDMKAY